MDLEAKKAARAARMAAKREAIKGDSEAAAVAEAEPTETKDSK